MDDIEEYLVDSDSLKTNNSNDFVIDEGSDVEDNAALSKYNEFLNSVSGPAHQEDQLLSLHKVDNDDTDKINIISKLNQQDGHDSSNLNISDPKNSEITITKSLNETAANLFNQYLNQAAKSPHVILANSRPSSSLGKKEPIGTGNENYHENKISATDLFNEYLNAALVKIANSRPSSPVNNPDDYIKNTIDIDKISDLAKSLYNDYLSVAVHSPIVLASSRPSSPINDESRNILINNSITEPFIEWNYPNKIIFGNPLSKVELNAICAEIEGEYSYDPPFGSILSVGTNSLNVTFIPNDLSKYLIVSKSVSIDVVEYSGISNNITDHYEDIKESYLVDLTEASVVDSLASETKKKSKNKKIKKVKTIRTASPSARNGSNRVTLPPVEAENNIRSSSAINKNKRPVSSHKGTNGLVMEGLTPQYSELVNGIFKRPIVVSILMPPMKELDHIYESRVTSPSNDRIGRVIASVQDHREQEMMKLKTEASVVSKEKVRRLPDFLVKVFDLVDSKEGVYDIIMRDFINLRTELINEISSEIKDYYKPNSISWWCTHLKLFLVVYVKPNSEFSVIVDKKAIKNFVKKKMQHHSWMKSAKFSYSSNEDSPIRNRNLLSANITTMNISWKKIEDIYYSISLSEKQGKYWNDMKILFSDINNSIDEINYFETDQDNDKFELTESWLKLEKAFKEIPISQQKGLQWNKLKNIFISARSHQNKQPIVGYNSDLDSIGYSEVSRNKNESIIKKKKVLKKIKVNKKKVVEENQVNRLPLISDTQNEEKRTLLKSRKSISPVNNRMKSSSSSTGLNPINSNRRGNKTTIVMDNNLSRAKSAPLSEVRESMKTALDKTICNKPVSAIILDDDYPEINEGRQLSIDEQADVCVDFIDQFPLLSEKSEIVKTSPIKKEKDNKNNKEKEKKKEKIESPIIEKKGIAIDPFSHPIPTKQYTGHKKIAIDIIKKAREETSKSKTFINRKISHVEVRLLDSPFAKKVFIPPPDLENLMSDLSVSSWNSSVH